MRISKLVVLDKNEFNPRQKEELRKLADSVVIFEDMPKNDNEAIKRIGDADALIVCWYSVSRKVLDSCPSIKYLGVVATGYHWLDSDSAIQKGIAVTNVPSYSTEAVSNHIFRQIERFGIKNKTLGIIGLGNIGARVAEIGKSKGLDVIYWNRTPKKSGFKPVELDAVFRKSDIIALLVKLNPETRKMVKKRHLDLMKSGAIIVDVVSPELFEDVGYLIRIAGSKNIKLVLDFDADNKLSELSKKNRNVIYTPHIAWKSEESILNLHNIAIENVKSYVAGSPKNRVQAKT